MKYKIKIDDFLQFNENCNVYIFDKNSKFLTCNDTQLEHLKKITRFSKLSDFVGKRMDEIFSKDAAKVIEDENKLVMSTGKVHQFMNYVYHEYFQSMVFVTVKTPIYDDNDNIVGVFGISHYLSTYQAPDFLSESLSKREIDCLQLLVKGKTATEISEDLDLSKRTVESYIEKIKSKLGCES